MHAERIRKKNKNKKETVLVDEGCRDGWWFFHTWRPFLHWSEEQKLDKRTALNLAKSRRLCGFSWRDRPLTQHPAPMDKQKNWFFSWSKKFGFFLGQKNLVFFWVKKIWFFFGSKKLGFFWVKKIGFFLVKKQNKIIVLQFKSDPM